jgi:hypothetical protein
MDLSELTHVLDIAASQKDMATHTFYGRMCRVPIADKENTDTTSRSNTKMMCIRSISVIVYTSDAAPRGVVIYASAKRWLDTEVEHLAGARSTRPPTRPLFWHDTHVVEVVDCTKDVVVSGASKKRRRAE